MSGVAETYHRFASINKIRDPFCVCIRQLAETGETIPYDAALVDLRKPTPDECAIGGELAPQLQAMTKEFAEQHGEPQGNP